VSSLIEQKQCTECGYYVSIDTGNETWEDWLYINEENEIICENCAWEKEHKRR